MNLKLKKSAYTANKYHQNYDEWLEFHRNLFVYISSASMVLQNYKNFTEMTSNMIYIVELGVGFKCPRKIHLNTQSPPLHILLSSEISDFIQYKRKNNVLMEHIFLNDKN